MINVDVATIANQYPESTLAAFVNNEAAVQQTLARSDFHPRYEHADEIGLAALITYGGTVLNPLTPGAINNPTSLWHNALERPSIWVPPTNSALSDSEIIGGEIPEELIGLRYVMFALGKGAEVSAHAGSTSFLSTGLTSKPGQVTLAGGRRIGNEIGAVSGAWEIHDDAILQSYITDLIRIGRGQKIGSVDEVANRLLGAFSLVKTTFPDEVGGLTPSERRNLRKLIRTNDDYFALGEQQSFS